MAALVGSIPAAALAAVNPGMSDHHRQSAVDAGNSVVDDATAPAVVSLLL
jgi:hypothetical protein